LKDLGPHLIDQAVYLFGFPQSVYADIRTTRETLWWMIGLTFYCIIPKYEYESWFFVREDSGLRHSRKKVFPETAGDVQEDDLKLGKTKFDSWNGVY
jgi:predicted dehydrogenase